MSYRFGCLSIFVSLKQLSFSECLLLGSGDGAVPAGSSTPQRGSTATGSSSSTGMTPLRTPVRGKMPPPSSIAPTFVTPARQKVMANWQPPPTPSTPQSKTNTPTFTLAQVKDLAQSKKLGSLTIPQLKQFLKDQNKRVGGNKPELIKRIETEVFNV
ncbi:uncharacterized protein LOC117640088 [Thrips palmi]|uniref:Uncharacterized protein LOC117640088 n=1 Tax=Thrips palmi TaxID=161013 RepID=A0A6P8Y804_THRPL|nr:uncharacterized protein LOC117640088 [Thrips palmi]